MNQSTYFCGIDVAKDTFVVSVKDHRFLIKNRVLSMERDGFDEFEQILADFKPNLVIEMEPTGIYHNNLLNFLKAREYNTVAVNPYMLHQFFKFTNSKPTKTEKKDSKTIAEFLEFEKDKFKDNPRSAPERESVRYFVREKERITH